VIRLHKWEFGPCRVKNPSICPATFRRMKSLDRIPVGTEVTEAIGTDMGTQVEGLWLMIPPALRLLLATCTAVN
jgi:hypothetical protein